MKRALLIAGGTVGGLGAVLAITPPNLSKTTLIAIDTAVPAPSATPTAAPAKPVGITGSFTGSVANTRYGPVQVITGPKDITQKELSLLIQYLTLSEKKQKAVIVFKVFRSPIL